MCRGARLVVAIVGRNDLDTGRCAQNMMLVAWNVGSARAERQRHPDAARTRWGSGRARRRRRAQLEYPPSSPNRSATPEEWSARADRKPLDELDSSV